MANTTKDHAAIKQWANSHNAQPSRLAMADTAKTVGLIQLHIPGYNDERKQYQHIEWDEFFSEFDKYDMEFRTFDNAEDPNYYELHTNLDITAGETANAK